MSAGNRVILKTFNFSTSTKFCPFIESQAKNYIEGNDRRVLRENIVFISLMGKKESIIRGNWKHLYGVIGKQLVLSFIDNF